LPPGPGPGAGSLPAIFPQPFARWAAGHGHQPPTPGLASGATAVVAAPAGAARTRPAPDPRRVAGGVGPAQQLAARRGPG
ncbi:hypothetical protein, partial [Enterococcus faecalis]|uniref:hypothetical protein n=1 Tax=Enterococcus faecalis TaxID=1351 RepID=UPI003CC579BA